MITRAQLAEVIRDNIHPGEDGPLTDLELDCANAVLAAIEGQEAEAPFRAPDEQDRLDAARFRFMRDHMVKDLEFAPAWPGRYVITVRMSEMTCMLLAEAARPLDATILPKIIDTMMGKSIILPRDPTSIPMPAGAAVPPHPPRPGMTDDERELLVFIANRVAYWTHYIWSPASEHYISLDGDLRAMINKVER